MGLGQSPGKLKGRGGAEITEAEKMPIVWGLLSLSQALTGVEAEVCPEFVILGWAQFPEYWDYRCVPLYQLWYLLVKHSGRFGFCFVLKQSLM